MSQLEDELYEIERELATGDGDTYRDHLTDEAIIVIPGQAMSKDETAAAMDQSPGWDEVEIEDRSIRELGPDAALLSYRFEGRRGSDRYVALMGSAYVRRDGAWKMAFHQQTPLES